jgi:hypothetical protein
MLRGAVCGLTTAGKHQPPGHNTGTKRPRHRDLHMARLLLILLVRLLVFGRPAGLQRQVRLRATEGGGSGGRSSGGCCRRHGGALLSSPQLAPRSRLGCNSLDILGTQHPLDLSKLARLLRLAHL